MSEDSGGAGGGTATASPASPAPAEQAPAEPAAAKADSAAPKADEAAAPASEEPSASSAGDSAPADAAPPEDSAAAPEAGADGDAAQSPDQGSEPPAQQADDPAAEPGTEQPAQQPGEPAADDAQGQTGTSAENGTQSELAQRVREAVPEPTPSDRLLSVSGEARKLSGTAEAARDEGRRGAAAATEAWHDGAGAAMEDQANARTAEADAISREATALADYGEAAAARADRGLQDRNDAVGRNENPYQLAYLMPGADRNVAHEQIVASTVNDVNRVDNATAEDIRNFPVGETSSPPPGSPTEPAPAPPPPGVQGAAGQAATGLDNAQAALDKAGQGPAELPQPPEGVTREEIDAHWNRLATEQPELVGNRDGVPAVARDTANRILLDRERDRLEAERDALIPQRDPLVAERETLQGPRHEAERRRVSDEIRDLDDKLAQLNDNVAGLNDIEGRLNETAHLSEGERHYLLGIDGHDDGRAIVAKGNPDTAQHVGTFVPGASTDLGSFGGVIDTANDIFREAQESLRDAGVQDPKTSVIGWLGYDAPDSPLPDAGGRSYAQDATDNLAGFQQGLRDSHYGAPSHNTLIGHSYGSTVAGYTARDYESLPVDDFVSISSPGLGVDNAEGLNLPPGHVWATESHNDAIADIGSIPFAPHGADPTGAGFGSQTFTTDPEPPHGLPDYLGDPRSHDGHLHGDNPALTNTGHIVADNPEKVR